MSFVVPVKEELNEMPSQYLCTWFSWIRGWLVGVFLWLLVWFVLLSPRRGGCFVDSVSASCLSTVGKTSSQLAP
jgi:hypothetical protein